MSYLIYQITARIMILTGCAMLIGVPITYDPAIIVFLCILALSIFGTWRLAKGWHRWGLALLIALGIGAKFIPLINIHEAHNIFLVDGNRFQALKQALPDNVYQHAKKLFNQAYPASQLCPNKTQNGCWRSYNDMTRPFAFSADAAFQYTSYSRIVHWIDFDSPSSLRGGFFNNTYGADYNTHWYYDDIAKPNRRYIPYFAAYILPASAEGLKLCWMGDIFIEMPPAVPEAHFANELTCKILPPDTGKMRIYGLSIDPARPLKMELLPTITAPFILQILHYIFSILGAAALAFMFLKPRWVPLIKLALSTGLVFTTILGHTPNLDNVPTYTLYHEPWLTGGSDQLTHWGFARIILEAISTGNWHEALRGGESIFYYMPGYRYFHAMEMAIFGESAMLSLAIFAAYPYTIYEMARRLINWPIALVITVLLFLKTYDDFISLTGYGEAVAYPVILCALALAISTIRMPYTQACGRLFAVALLLAIATFIRPNVIIADLLLLAYLWLHRRHDEPIKTGLIIAAGFSPVLLMLAHNLYFGGEWVLLTSAANAAANLHTSPDTYAEAFKAIITGNTYAPPIMLVKQQIANWLFGDAGLALWIGTTIAILTGLLITQNIYEMWNRLRSGIDARHMMIALYVIGLQSLLLFYHTSGRYVLLACHLTLFLMVAIGLMMLHKKRIDYV